MYPDIEESMSDSNIGARRHKNVRNHLFVIHGIVNSVVYGEDDCVDIQIYDLVQAFDALWLKTYICTRSWSMSSPWPWSMTCWEWPSVGCCQSE